MKTLKKLIIVTIIAISGIVSAHQNHDKMMDLEISKSAAILVATNEVKLMIEAKILESGWDTVESKSAVLDRINGRQVWNVSLSREVDTVTETLNVYLSKTGVFISTSK